MHMLGCHSDVRHSLFKNSSKQSKAKQSKAKQSKAKQSKAKQSRAKQSKAKQSKKINIRFSSKSAIKTLSDVQKFLESGNGQHLSQKNNGGGLIERGAIHVDSGTQWQHEADYASFATRRMCTLHCRLCLQQAQRHVDVCAVRQITIHTKHCEQHIEHAISL